MVGIMGWWNTSRHRRAAINQAQIRKECRLYGSFMEGARAFREGRQRDCNPHDDLNQAGAWFHGWDLAQAKQWEKDNAPT